MYVDELVAPDTVNTMPEKTMEAVRRPRRDRRRPGHRRSYDEARQVMDDLERLGIDYDDVIATLEDEGVDKFVTSWQELARDRQGAARSCAARVAASERRP